MRRIFAILIFLWTTSAMAGSWGIIGGINGSQASNESAPPFDSPLERPSMGFQFGTHYTMSFNGFRIRILGQLRTLRARHKEVDQNLNVYSLQFATPILFEQMLTESFGFFIGPDLAVKLRELAKRNSGNYDLKFSDFVTSGTAGLTFRMTGKLYANVFYTQGFTEVAENNITFKTAGVQFVTYFEKPKRYR